MIVFSYGITKSGSTLAFELIKGCLESAGHRQLRLADGLVEPEHGINFLAIRRHEPEDIERLIAAVPQDTIIAVKTHDSFAARHRPVIEAACREGTVLAQVVHRDPRDTCLSMVDAGAAARAAGHQAFSELATLDDALDAVTRQMRNLERWLAMPHVLEFEYEELVTRPYDCIEKIADTLGIEPEPGQAYRHAYVDAFTQKNKARLSRHRQEMAPADAARIVERFRPYMERHGYLP